MKQLFQKLCSNPISMSKPEKEKIAPNAPIGQMIKRHIKLSMQFHFNVEKNVTNIIFEMWIVRIIK